MCKKIEHSWLRAFWSQTWEKILVLPLNWGFPGGASGKEPSCNAEDIRDAGSIPGLGRSPGGELGNPLPYSRLERSMDRGAWRATVPRVAKS